MSVFLLKLLAGVVVDLECISKLHLLFGVYFIRITIRRNHLTSIETPLSK